MDLGTAERANNNNNSSSSSKQKIVAVVKKEDQDHEDGCGEDDTSSKKKKGVVLGSSAGKKSSSTSSSNNMKCCQAEKCTADLSDAKQYHRRHKVCEYHAKAQVVLVAGVRQRFCQQCSRFHELSEFDETRRSCRRRLAGHNERRRKSSTETQSEGGSGRKGAGTQLKDNVVCGQVDDRGRIEIAVQENATYKHFHIR